MSKNRLIAIAVLGLIHFGFPEFAKAQYATQITYPTSTTVITQSMTYDRSEHALRYILDYCPRRFYTTK